MRIAVSGHRGLPEPTVALVNAALRAELARHLPDLVGVTCLADGADQLFARAVVDLGGQLSVIIPAQRYREGLPPQVWPTYDEMLAAAAEVRYLDFVESTPEAHMAASVEMLASAKLLLAVWDGKPARAYGGTADVVELARSKGVTTVVVWPEGSSRD